MIRLKPIEAGKRRWQRKYSNVQSEQQIRISDDDGDDDDEREKKGEGEIVKW